MKRLGIALLSACCGLIVGAAVLYLATTVLATTPWIGQLTAGILALAVSFGLAAALSRSGGRLTGNLVATLVALPVLFGVFLGCGLIWALLAALIVGQ